MDIPAIEASNYFRGLLLLIKRDRKVTQSEVDLMMRIGKALGFEEEFCKQSVEGILENEHVREHPPKFSDRNLAMKFIRDGLVLSYSDNEMHPLEEEWLKFVAELNGLGPEWFQQEKEKAAIAAKQHPHLEIESLRAAELRK